MSHHADSYGALLVTVGAYESVDTALHDYDAVKSLFQRTAGDHQFDAVVVARGKDGSPHELRKHEHATRSGARRGLAIGIALGLVGAFFPAGALATTVIAGGGSALGAVAGHIRGGLSTHDAEAIGETLGAGDAALVVVHDELLADAVVGAFAGASRVTTGAGRFTRDSVEAAAAESCGNDETGDARRGPVPD